MVDNWCCMMCALGWDSSNNAAATEQTAARSTRGGSFNNGASAATMQKRHVGQTILMFVSKLRGCCLWLWFVVVVCGYCGCEVLSW